MSRWFGKRSPGSDVGSPHTPSDDGSELHQSALNYTPVLGASKQAANIQSPGSASSEPPALVPKIETLRAHIAKLRTNIKNWDEDFVNELEKCIQEGGGSPETTRTGAALRPTVRIAGVENKTGVQV